MIAKDIQVVDIDPFQWVNLFTVFAKEKTDGKKKRLPTLTIYHDNGKVLKALHSEKGVLRNFSVNSFEPLQSILAEHNLGSIQLIEASALENIFSRFQRNLNMTDDLVKQGLTIYDVVRSEIGKGIKIYPAPRLPGISYKFIQRIFNFILKDETSFVFYVFDNNKVYTSLIIGKKDGDIFLFTTQDTLTAEGLNATNPRSDHATIEIGIKKKFGLEPGIGIYAHLEEIRKYASRGKLIGGLRRMHRRGTALLHPFPLRMRILFWLADIFGK